MMLKLQRTMRYHEGDTSAGSWDDLVALLPNHGSGKLIDGLLRLCVTDANIFLKLVGFRESAAIGMSQECTYHFFELSSRLC